MAEYVTSNDCVLNQMVDNEEEKCIREATLACIVGTNDGQKYAMTSEHVILNTDGNVYWREPLVLENRLGICKSRGNKLKLDIGLVNLDKKIRRLCRNDLYDPLGIKRSWKTFEGSYASLVDKHVFKCIPLNKRSSNSTKFRTPLTGKVASASIHEQHLDVLGKHCFLVESELHESFAKEGESGTLLATDIGDTDVYLIGIISGLLQRDCQVQKFTICVFLSSALKCLSENSQTPLSMCTEMFTASVDTEAITCGSTVLFKRVEKIKKCDFEIEEQILHLFNIDFQKDDNSLVDIISKCERQFRKKVFAREQIKDMAIYEPDRPEQVTLIYFYMTVHNLYEQNHEKAECFLKEGIRCLSKVKQSQLKLLSKCVTYVTWLFINMNENAKLEIILNEGLQFFKENETLPNFPKECLGYHYYDYSRFYVNQKLKDEATSMAKLGYECFESMLKDCSRLHFVQSTEYYRDLFNRYVFSVCQFIAALLWCGENFEYAEECIHEEAIATAERLIECIEHNIHEAPAVQRTLYHLAKCDIYYRKQDYKNAFESAKLCLDIAKCHNLEEEQCSAGKRCVALTKKIRASSKL